MIDLNAVQKGNDNYFTQPTSIGYNVYRKNQVIGHIIPQNGRVNLIKSYDPEMIQGNIAKILPKALNENNDFLKNRLNVVVSRTKI